MAELHARLGFTEHHRIDKTTVLYAAIAGVVICGPLLGMMGFVFLATATLVLFAAPLMLLFSPIIVPAGFVLAASMLGFGVAIGMALVGASALNCAYESVGGVGRIMNVVRGSGGDVDFRGYLEQKKATA